ncbi:MAG: hypothetical protein M5U28_51280 [Sandaracinaceae bacterium]|nr:hypothetical protein [Sandaracinaceae bacterium]
MTSTGLPLTASVRRESARASSPSPGPCTTARPSLRTPKCPNSGSGSEPRHSSPPPAVTPVGRCQTLQKPPLMAAAALCPSASSLTVAQRELSGVAITRTPSARRSTTSAWMEMRGSSIARRR